MSPSLLAGSMISDADWTAQFRRRFMVAARKSPGLIVHDLARGRNLRRPP